MSLLTKIEAKLKTVFSPKPKQNQSAAVCSCGFSFDGDVNHFHCENSKDPLPENEMPLKYQERDLYDEDIYHKQGFKSFEIFFVAQFQLGRENAKLELKKLLVTVERSGYTLIYFSVSDLH